ncbi:hypothetical protein [Mobiluncus curtisii]|nr:hypothetical protein [Mobiluncus curtisii]
MGKCVKPCETEQLSPQGVLFADLMIYIYLERFAQLNRDFAKSLSYQKFRKDIYDRNAAFRVIQMVHRGNFECAYALLVKTFPEIMKEYESRLPRGSAFLELAWARANIENPNIPDIEYPELLTTDN